MQGGEIHHDSPIKRIAGVGDAGVDVQLGFDDDAGAAIDARLSYPWGVAVDDAGNLFILDAFNYLVRKVAANGIITTFAGGGSLAGSAGDGGPATSALISAWGAAIDRAGNLLIEF